MEKRRLTEGLAEYIARRYRAVVEIGIGHFPEVALSLIDRGVSVFATDIYPFSHRSLHLVSDDITAPDLSVYRHVDLLYAIRPPSELVPYMKRAASMLASDLIVRSLSSEFLDGEMVRQKSNYFYLWRYR